MLASTLSALTCPLHQKRAWCISRRRGILGRPGLPWASMLTSSSLCDSSESEMTRRCSAGRKQTDLKRMHAEAVLCKSQSGCTYIYIYIRIYIYIYIYIWIWSHPHMIHTNLLFNYCCVVLRPKMLSRRVRIYRYLRCFLHFMYM